MIALPPLKATNRHYRCLRKKRKMKQKNELPAIHATRKPSNMCVFLTLLGLGAVFFVLVYFQPH